MEKNSKTRIGGGAHRSLSQQPSGFIPVLGFRKSEILKKKFKAFTLAEVLITLAIIGVVAALTIPAVVAKYQKAQYYTQFMKVYNTLSEVLSLSQADNGYYGAWASDICFGGNCSEISDKYLAPYLKVARSCDENNYKDCIGDELNALSDGDYAKERAEVMRDEFIGEVSRAYLLQDGSSIVLCEFYPQNYMVFYTDTNGPKGPNEFGRDIFFFNVLKEENDSLRGWADYIDKTFSKDMGSGRIDIKYANCDPSEPNSVGDGCAARLLLEGKMSY